MDYRKEIKYDSKRRFSSYWHQIQETLACSPLRVLEVGVGTRFVSRYLSVFGISVVTVDIDADTHPDVVASVTKLPFPDNTFDTVVACEILEHLPYEESLRALQELHRVTSQWLVISLPDATPAAAIQFPIPYIRKVKWLLSVPAFFPRVHHLTKSGHHWEIGKKKYPLERIKEDFLNAGFTTVKTYRVFENPYHRFFILEKKYS